MTIDGSYLFLGLIAMGGFLTWYAGRRPNILLAFCAGLTWWGLAFWMFISASAPIGLTEDWMKLLVWVFFILGFIPFLLQMDTEVKREMYNQKGKLIGSYSEFGGKPKGEKIDIQAEYKKMFHNKIHGRRRR